MLKKFQKTIDKFSKVSYNKDIVKERGNKTMTTIKQIAQTLLRHRKQKKCSHEIYNIIDSYKMESYGKLVTVNYYKCAHCGKTSTITS